MPFYLFLWCLHCDRTTEHARDEDGCFYCCSCRSHQWHGYDISGDPYERRTYSRRGGMFAP